MVSLLKKHKTIKKVLLVLLVSFLSFVVFSVAASAVVFEFIFQRADYYDETLPTYADLDEKLYPRKEVGFASSNGKLYGYFYGLDIEHKNGVVIIAGGIQSSAERYLSAVTFFVDNGWCVFCYDGTGVGKSDGDSLVGLPQNKVDLINAIDFVRQEPKLTSLPLVLYGHSVGGYASLAAINDRPEEIAAVVSMGAFEAPAKTMHYHAKQYVGILADIEYPFLCFHNWMLFGNDANESAIDAINSTDIPILIIEGSDDKIVPKDISIGNRLGDITNPNVSYIEIDDNGRNGHSTMWLSADAAEYGAKLYALIEQDDTAELDIDRLRAHSVDEELMNCVLSLFNEAAKG